MDKRTASWIHRYLDFSFAHPYRILVVAGIAFAVSSYLSAQLKIRSSFLELLPDNSPEVADLNFVAKRSGGDGYLVVAVDAHDLDQAKAFAAKLSPEVEKLTYEDETGQKRPLVNYVEYHYDVQWFRQRALLLLPLDQLQELTREVKERVDYEKAKATGLLSDIVEAPPDFAQIEGNLEHQAEESGIKNYPEYLISKDGKYLYLFAKPNGVAGDLRYCHHLVDDVGAVARNVAGDFPGMSPPKLAGMYVIRIEEDRIIWRDIWASSILSNILAMIVILGATRFRPVALALVMVPMLLGVAVSMGIVRLAIDYVSIVTGFLIPVLIGLGIEYGIHISMRYWEERADLPPREAMYTAIRGTIGGAITSAATNGLAFFVLVFAKFHAFQQFGFIAAVGIALTLIAAYLICPAILVVAEKIRPFKVKPKPAPEPGSVDHTPHPIRRLLPTPVLMGATAAMLFAGLYSGYAFRPKFDSDMRSLSRNDAVEFDAYISKSLGVDIVPAIAWAQDQSSAKKVEEFALDVRKARGESNIIETIASINDLVPLDQKEKMVEISKLKRMLDRAPPALLQGADPKKIETAKKMVGVQPYTIDDVPKSVSRRFMALDGVGTFVLLFPKPVGLYDGKALQTWSSELTDTIAMAKAAGIETHILHESRIAAKIFQLVLGDGPLILGGAAIVVFVVLLIDLRSFRRAFLIMGPLGLGFAWLLGAMRVFNLSLNVLNVAVLPNLVAIAVDNAVHIFHRYHEEGPGSLPHVIRHTGLAAAVATFANGSGYAALIIAEHYGLKTVAYVAILGVTCTSIGTTVFFPALLALGERYEIWRTLRRSSGGKPGETKAA
jgi:uncharacterized protein